MPIYMRFEPPPGRSRPDISGSVTAVGYRGWIALESVVLTLERDGHHSDPATAPPVPASRESQRPARGSGVRSGGAPTGASSTQRATAAQTDTTQRRESALTRRLALASRLVNTAAGHSHPVLRPVVMRKRLDAASALLYGWAASGMVAGGSHETQDIVIHVVHMALDGTGRPAPTIVYGLRRCIAEAFETGTLGGDGWPLERLVVRATILSVSFQDTDASGRRGDTTEMEIDVRRSRDE